jgi:Domain of unknown function (DUF4259)
MGAWGTGSFENDAALDFVAAIKRAKKTSRAARLKVAFEEYLQFDLDLKNGKNIQQMSSSDIADLIASRNSTLDWYQSTGQEFPFHVLPQYASEESIKAWVADLSEPQIIDGNDQASRAIAAASILVSKRSGVIVKTTSNIDLDCSDDELEALCYPAVAALEAILTNTLLADSWGNSEWEEISADIKNMISVLSPNSAI